MRAGVAPKSVTHIRRFSPPFATTIVPPREVSNSRRFVIIKDVCLLIEFLVDKEARFSAFDGFFNHS